jgi:hypothetical protein
MKRFLLAVFLSIPALSSYAQLTSCAQTLRLARSTYEQGRLHEIPTLMTRCLENGFTQQEKVEAYKLLCLSYIYLEEPQKADEAMLRLLQTDNYFEINESTDPAEFIALYRTFRTAPIYRLGVNLGVNATQPNVSEAIETSTADSEYSYGIAFQVGVNAEIPLRNKLTLNPSLLFQQKSFSIRSELDRQSSTSGAALKNRTDGREVHTWISIPVAVQYQLRSGRYNPYVSAGISADYLLRPEITVETIQDGAGAVQEQTYDIEREKINLSAIVSAGGKLRIFGGYFTTEVRYAYGLTRVNSSKTAEKNQILAFNNNLGDSLFKLSSLSVTVGYVQNIFNPKKLSARK